MIALGKPTAPKGIKTSDVKKYQREYMKKYRAKKTGKSK